MRHEAQVSEVDPFELPDWLGTGDVTWTAGASVRQAHRVDGELSAGSHVLACDLLAADQAYPQPVLDEKWRQQAHRTWTHGQVLLIEYDGRLTFAPRLPPEITRLTFRLSVQGRCLAVEVSQDAATYRLIGGERFDIWHHGEPVTVESGSTVTHPIPPPPEVGPIRQPAGREPRTK